MSAGRPYAVRAESYLDQARLFHEPHLAAQRLSEEAINGQTLEQLHESLAKLYILYLILNNSGSFGSR